MRAAQPFPNLAVGVNSFNFPKRRESWRLVSLRATVTLGSAALGQQVLVSLIDGAGNAIASWSSSVIPAPGFLSTFTWSADVDGSAQAAGGFGVNAITNIAIPADVWVLPQWTLQLGTSPTDAGDQLTNIMVQSEWYPDKISRDKVPAQAQES
jgi:hypothetical protein